MIEPWWRYQRKLAEEDVGRAWRAERMGESCEVQPYWPTRFVEATKELDAKDAEVDRLREENENLHDANVALSDSLVGWRESAQRNFDEVTRLKDIIDRAAVAWLEDNDAVFGILAEANE